jgi:hypothetical protein
VGEEVDVLQIVAGMGARLVEGLQPAAEVLGSLQVCRSLERTGSGRMPERDRLCRLRGTGPVVGDDLGLSFGQLGEAADERVGDATVEGLAAAAQDPLVGRLLQQRMRELVAQSRVADGPEHVLGGELGERQFEICAAQRPERLEQLPVELPSEDRGHVDDVAELG